MLHSVDNTYSHCLQAKRCCIALLICILNLIDRSFSTFRRLTCNLSPNQLWCSGKQFNSSTSSSGYFRRKPFLGAGTEMEDSMHGKTQIWSGLWLLVAEVDWKWILYRSSLCNLSGCSSLCVGVCRVQAHYKMLQAPWGTCHKVLSDCEGIALSLHFGVSLDLYLTDFKFMYTWCLHCWYMHYIHAEHETFDMTASVPTKKWFMTVPSYVDLVA